MPKPNDQLFHRTHRQYQLLWQALNEINYAWIKWKKFENWGSHNSYIPALVNYAPGKTLAVFIERTETPRGYPSKTYKMLDEYGVPYLILKRGMSKTEMLWTIKSTIEKLRSFQSTHSHGKRLMPS